MAYYFGIYMNLGLNGLWFGMGFGIIFLILCFLQLIVLSDWKAISIEIQKELKRQVLEYAKTDSGESTKSEEDKVVIFGD